MIKIRLMLALLLMLGASACVPQQQLKDMETQRNMLDDDNVKLRSEVDQLREQLANEQQQRSGLRDALRTSHDSLAQQQDQLRQEAQRYTDLMQRYQMTRQGTQEEMRLLLEQIQHNQAALREQEDDITKAEKTLYDRTLQIKNLEQELGARNQRLLALEHALHQQDSVSVALKQKVSEALLSFEGKGLSVTMRNGKVYVSMEEKLMFASGRFEMDQKGSEALRSLTRVLEANPDISVIIEGHTDDVPYKGTGELKDNWDLSCKRATTVVRLLLNDTKIAPSRITAAGRSQYAPLNTGTTAAARQENRRIEVILIPKLDEVLKMLE